MKLLLILIFVLCSFPSLAQTSNSSSLTRKNGKVYISQSRYTFSKVVSVFPGFGIGHAVQGRWLERGWKFTAGSSLVLGAGLILTFALSSYFARDIDIDEDFSIFDIITGQAHLSVLAGSIGAVGTGFLIGGSITLLLFSAVHVWGAVDTWKLPSNYKITNLSIAPKFYSYRDQTFMGLSLNYKW